MCQSSLANELELPSPSSAKQTGKKGSLVISFSSPAPTSVERLTQDCLCALVCHYFQWWWAFAAVSAAASSLGLGKFVLAAWAIYLPTYLRPRHFTLTAYSAAALKSKLWTPVQTYFNLRLHRVAPLDRSKRYVFGLHPHGNLVLSRLALAGESWDELFPGIETRTLAATPIFYFPGARELSLALGAIDAGRCTAAAALSAGKSICLWPGGNKEIFCNSPNRQETVLYLTRRLGFVRLAMQNGASLVPTYVFNEKYAYNQLDMPEFIWKNVLKVFKMPVLIFWGRFCTWMPFRVPLSVVFGEPIEVPQIAEPTDDQVRAVMVKYVEAVRALFEEHKAAYSCNPDETLVIL